MPNEELIGLQNKIADLTEAGAITQILVQKISTTLTNTNTVLASLGTLTTQITTPFSTNSVGPDMAALGASAVGSIAWPTSNQGIFVPFYITTPKTAYKMFVHNGATASGNLDVGIYDSTGAKLVTMGSTAQAGINALQILDIADTVLAAGNYYMAIAMDGTVGTAFMAGSIASVAAEAFNVRRMASAFPLPTSATFAASVGTSKIPLFGISFRSDLT